MGNKYNYEQKASIAAFMKLKSSCGRFKKKYREVYRTAMSVLKTVRQIRR